MSQKKSGVRNGVQYDGRGGRRARGGEACVGTGIPEVTSNGALRAERKNVAGGGCVFLEGGGRLDSCCANEGQRWGKGGGRASSSRDVTGRGERTFLAAAGGQLAEGL